MQIQRIFIFGSLLATSLLKSSLVLANVVGSNLQSFNPTTDGLDFVTVQSARALPSGYIVLGGFVDFASNPLPDALDGVGQKYRVKSHLLSSDFHFGLGLLKDWEIGMNLTSVINGTVETPQLQSYFQRQGLTDARIETKYRLFGRGANGLGAIFSANFPQVSNDAFQGAGNHPMYEGELAWESGLAPWLWALNAGVRFRNPGPKIVNGPYEPVSNQFLVSTALAYHFARSNWNMIGEIYSARPLKGTDHYSASDLTSVEALLGMKYWAFKSAAIHFGAGAGLLNGMNAPDWRVYVGLNWFPIRLWGRRSTTKAQSVSEYADSKRPAQEVPSAVAAKSSKASDLSVFDQNPTQIVEKFSVREINFASGSDEVPESFMPYLKRMVEYINKGQALRRLTISGHTDNQGPAVYNQDLSVRRAESVKRVMVEHFDVEPERVETLGYGMSNPIDDNATAEGRSRNRRVEFEIEREH